MMRLMPSSVMLAALGLILAALPSLAQQASTCHAIAGYPERSLLHRAALNPSLASDEVAISYVGHSAFRIETPQGATVVTDYYGSNGAGGTPDIVTMNHAHETHFTSFPDPTIAHPLRGWNHDGKGPAKHYLEWKDLLVRNVTSDLYSGGFMYEADGNSIFIFETAGLCIGHLGHLHHKLTPEKIAEIGRIDILFVPVDGTYTMSQEGMIELANTLRSSVVIPMHYFSNFSLARFVDGMTASFDIVQAPQNTVRLSARELPKRPQVLVIPLY